MHLGLGLALRLEWDGCRYAPLTTRDRMGGIERKEISQLPPALGWSSDGNEEIDS